MTKIPKVSDYINLQKSQWKTKRPGRTQVFHIWFSIKQILLWTHFTLFPTSFRGLNVQYRD